MDERISCARKNFSRVGFAILTMLGVTLVLQSGITTLLYSFFPQIADEAWVVLLSSFAPQYAVAFPLCILVFQTAPETPLQPAPIPFKNLMAYLLVSLFMMYAGNLLGSAVTALLQLIPGVVATNPVMTMVELDSPVLLAIITVVLAPVVEEFIFRKLIIDRLHVYGGPLAVVFSAAMFGLFHGNLSQLFYAFALGLVFGYLYLRTGRLRYSVFLHAFINFIGSVIAPLVLKLYNADETLSSLWDIAAGGDSLWPAVKSFLSYLLLQSYSALIICGAVAGLVLFCIHIKKLPFEPAPMALEPEQRFRTAFCNPGTLVFSGICLLSIVLTIFI